MQAQLSQATALLDPLPVRPAGMSLIAAKITNILVTTKLFEIEDAHAYLAKLEADHQGWFDRFDFILSHPLSAERGEVVEAMRCAPDSFLRGMLFSAHTMSLQIEQVTGRA